mmetsp:Transcript_3531/g.9915  ORF Transcript_3531/g.9915 Transcript_3531/m.9915 type:complete len:274 (+) Transcript_3531:188-1009(+)
MISRFSRSVLCQRFQPGRFGSPNAIIRNLPENQTDQYWSQRSRSLSSFVSSPSPSLSASQSQWHPSRIPARSDNSFRSNRVRSYFTSGEVTKKDDPYAVLGLQWGDGATTAEIRQAFRERAKALHPDVVDTSVMSIEQARTEFQNLVRAYEALTKHVQNGAGADHDSVEEWRVDLWRQSDRIALDRTDVAGVARKRPAKPAQTAQRKQYGRELGHPSGRGVGSRGEYLAAGGTTNESDGTGNSRKKKLRSSSVGRGQSKWIKKKAYEPWQPSS